MACPGQLSLEYLLVLAAAFSVFALLLPLMHGVYAASVFGLDALNAESFSSSLQQGVEEMHFQGEGSLQEIEARPLGAWRFSFEGKRLLLSVEGPGSREKSFEVFFPNEVGFSSFDLERRAVFSLGKSSGRLWLEYD